MTYEEPETNNQSMLFMENIIHVGASEENKWCFNSVGEVKRIRSHENLVMTIDCLLIFLDSLSFA